MNQDIDKQESNKRGNPAWIKGGRSPNPNGRPKSEESLRSALKAIGEQRARLTKQERESIKRFGYRADWTNQQVFAAKLWARIYRDDEFGMTTTANYTEGRPVPLTDMPTVVVNQQTVVQQHQETSIDKAVGAFKALVEAGIVPVEIFQQYAVTSGNGHDESDR